MSNSTPSGLSVVIPAYNEKNGIESVIRELHANLNRQKIPYEIIVVNDGSSDGTKDVLSKINNIRPIHHETNKGYGRSLADGIKEAQYEHIAILDADGTYPAEDFKPMLDEYQNVDMVIGWRKKVYLPGAVLPKMGARKLLHWLAWYLCGHHIIDLNSGFRIFKKEFYTAHMNEFPSGFSFTTTLTMLAHFSGRSIQYIPIQYKPRIGTTKVKYFYDGVRVAIWMLKLALRYQPAVIVFPFVILGAIAVRWVGIDFALPITALPDEPHHVNLAVYFGSGDLNPHIFKYPTLWMYTLFLSYGIIYLFWSGMGLYKTAIDFAHLYVWDPTLFYLTARGLAGALGSASLIFVFLSSRRIHTATSGLISTFLLATCPLLVYFGHQAKADMLMMFLCSITVWLCIRYVQDGRARNILTAGLTMGLALSTQYTAALLAPIILLSTLLRTKAKGTYYLLLFSHVLILIGFFIGTPYAFFDHQTFLTDIQDLISYGEGDWTVKKAKLGLGIFLIFGQITSLAWIGLPLLILGGVGLFKTSRKMFFLLMGPIVWSALLLGSQNEQTVVENYAFAVFPIVGMVAGFSWVFISKLNLNRAIYAVFYLIIALPAMTHSIHMVQNYLRPDTRLMAQHWIEKNIPAGKRILQDQVHTMPRLIIDKNQLQKLHERMANLNHPRQHYYKFLIDSHPGGGYTIFLIKRSAHELVTQKRLTEWSQKGYAFLKTDNGLDDLRAAQIDYVIWSSAGARRENSPRLLKYFDDLENKTQLIKEFTPKINSYSPTVRIYKIPKD